MRKLIELVQTGKTHKEESFLVDPTPTLRSNNGQPGKWQAAVINQVMLSAETYLSRRAGSLGEPVKTVKVTFHGQLITNYPFKGCVLATEELENLKSTLNDKSFKPDFSQGNPMVIYSATLFYRQQPNGHQLLQIRMDGGAGSNVPRETVTINGREQVVDALGCLNEGKAFAVKIIDVVLGDKEWLPYLKSTKDGGFVQIEEGNSTKDTEAENEAQQAIDDAIAAATNTTATTPTEGVEV